MVETFRRPQGHLQETLCDQHLRELLKLEGNQLLMRKFPEG